MDNYHLFLILTDNRVVASSRFAAVLKRTEAKMRKANTGGAISSVLILSYMQTVFRSKVSFG